MVILLNLSKSSLFPKTWDLHIDLRMYKEFHLSGNLSILVFLQTKNVVSITIIVVWFYLPT